MARKILSKSARKPAKRTGAPALPAGRLRLDLPNFVPYRITTLAALVRRELAKIYRDDPGLNEPEWKVMTTLAHFGPLPSGEIGQYVTLDRVAVSRALTRLIDLGLATRMRNAEDQRMYTVDLTPRAARLYDRMSAQALAIEETILAALDQDEVHELLELLDKVESCFRSPADRRRLLLMRDLESLPPAAKSPGRKSAGKRGQRGAKTP